MTTRWDEQCVHPQCAGCNMYNYGEVTLYRMYIVKKYGQQAAQRLDTALLNWKSGNVKPIPINTLKELLELYTQKLKDLPEHLQPPKRSAKIK